MIKNERMLNKFYLGLMAKEKMPYRKAFKIFESLYNEARHLGVINSRTIWDGIEVDIKIAKAINQVK